MPSTTRSTRANGSSLAAHYVQMRRLMERAGVAVARARRLRRDWPADGSCRWCGDFGSHADGCLNVGDGRG